MFLKCVFHSLHACENLLFLKSLTDDLYCDG